MLALMVWVMFENSRKQAECVCLGERPTDLHRCCERAEPRRKILGPQRQGPVHSDGGLGAQASNCGGRACRPGERESKSDDGIF